MVRNWIRSLAAGLLLCCMLQTDAQVVGSNTVPNPYISYGPAFTLGAGTGACATVSTLTGGRTAGSFLCTGTAGASTQVINLPPAPHGWACKGFDITTPAVLAQTSPLTATSCKISGSVGAANDVLTFAALGY